MRATSASSITLVPSGGAVHSDPSFCGGGSWEQLAQALSFGHLHLETCDPRCGVLTGLAQLDQVVGPMLSYSRSARRVFFGRRYRLARAGAALALKSRPDRKLRINQSSPPSLPVAAA